MKFVIRDDDLNCFSTPADIDRWYADVFAKHIPVGFASIPYIKPSGDAYGAHMPSSTKEHPIGVNKGLISYVKSQTFIEVLQHGTTHETKGRVHEYAGDVSRSEARRGREELERAFGTQVRIFVPPHDWIGTEGIRAVEEAGMDIIRGRGAGLRNFIFRFEYFLIFLQMLAFKLKHALSGKIPAYPHVLNFGKHKEVCSYRLEDDDVFEGLEYAKRTNGIFVVVTHLHFYTEEKKDRLLKIIARAKELGAEFVRPSALFT